MKMDSHSRTFVAVSLVLAAVLVVGVLAGAKVYFNRVALQPVSMPVLPSPDASSAECSSLVDALPDVLSGHRRAELAEPAPDGAAAWQSSSTERVTVRCGVDVPLQYTDYTPTVEAGGARWIRIDDPVPGSHLTTWYTVDRVPVVAVTADRSADEPIAEVGAGQLPQADISPAPAPLSQLAAGPETDNAACRPFMDALPATLASGYERIDVPEPASAAWLADGAEPIVVRCNVAHPENYEPGLQLYQINGVTWFEDTDLGGGTGNSVWFALGRDAVIAAYLPQSGGNEAVTALSEVIESSVPVRS